MILTEATARKILNLNPLGSIDSDIAERQFKVIVKGFNHLIQEDSQFLYLADEVGLGKTYIALGIAFLLRHFSDNNRLEIHKDVIIVPKRNLQYKWLKEIKNFGKNNYLLDCNIVRSSLGTLVGICSEESIHQKLSIINKDVPSYEIFRNSSFSIATSEYTDWKAKLVAALPVYLQEKMQEGIDTFKDDIYVKRLFAYLLNCSFPYIDTLIVDEAHNFKHGIGNHVSYRNQLVSRTMGVVQTEEDQVIFDHFPELQDRISPKIGKLIFLSATPIDINLIEIKNQLDCFLPIHPFKFSENPTETIRESLSSFMIRGVMKITLGDEPYSRNMYRHEHRKGNVIKEENAIHQRVDDDLTSIILGLLQYKTLKHLNESNNNNFEIGMLAGFETFKITSEPKNKKQEGEEDEKEFEDSNSNETKSLDGELISNIAKSYFKEFDEHLPHPKQDNLINALFENYRNGEKSLVFVRRIASVIELERKLMLRIEDYYYGKIKNHFNKNESLKQLKKAFKDRHQVQEIDDVLYLIAKRLLDNYGRQCYEVLYGEDDEQIREELYQLLVALFYNGENTGRDYNFKLQVKKHTERVTISKKLRLLSKRILLDSVEKRDYLLELEDDDFAEGDDASGFFFNSYFSSKRYKDGFNFRKRNGTKDSYQFNVFYLEDKVEELYFDYSNLSHIYFDERVKTESRRMEAVNDQLKDSTCLNPTQKVKIDHYFVKKTFLNLLFEDVLKDEFNFWIQQHWIKIEGIDTFWSQLSALSQLIEGIFRNGSGLLPAYIADTIENNDYEENLLQIIKTDFPEIIKELKSVIVDFDKIIATNFSDYSKIQRALYGQSPIVGVSGSHKRNVSNVATQFRMPGFPYVLFTTDILKEGEDLHLYCSHIYHYGIAWNPSDMEQRTGRIDRISSKNYFELKEAGKKNFDNALQVFYPYLADTLEVNQVAKVFYKMNNFVTTFYDGLTVEKADTKASIDTVIEQMPKQIGTLLSSRYDYDVFIVPTDIETTPLIIREGNGISKNELISRIDEVLEIIKEQWQYYSKPKISYSQFKIEAVVNNNQRRAPLTIQLVKGDKFGNIEFKIKSKISRSGEIRSKNIRVEITEILKENKLLLEDDYNYLYAAIKIPFKSTTNHFTSIVQLVFQIADQLEEQYTGKDSD